MGSTADVIRLAILAVGAALVFSCHREVKEAIERFWDNFPRGGPPNPMHPSPADDSDLLRRRRTP